MSKKQYKEMGSLLPVYLAYMAAGITKSEYYDAASRTLWGYHNASTKNEKDVKMRELFTTTIRFIDELEPILQAESSTAQGAHKRAKSKKEKTLLDKKLSRFRNAAALTTRLRSKYSASTSYSQENSTPLSSGIANVGQPVQNADESYDQKIQQEPATQAKMAIEKKPAHPFFPETNEEWIKARTSAGDRIRSEQLAQSKSTCYGELYRGPDLISLDSRELSDSASSVNWA